LSYSFFCCQCFASLQSGSLLWKQGKRRPRSATLQGARLGKNREKIGKKKNGFLQDPEAGSEAGAAIRERANMTLECCGGSNSLIAKGILRQHGHYPEKMPEGNAIQQKKCNASSMMSGQIMA
jgi:hypothetical protein